VRGLVLLAPALRMAETLLRDEQAGAGLLARLVHPGQRAFFASLPQPTIVAEWERRQFLPVVHPAWRGTTAWGIRSVRDMLDKHSAVDGASPRVPTLVIHGTADDVISPDSSKRWIASFEQGQGQELPPIEAMFVEGGDHQLANVEDQVMTAIERWITALAETL
jgi:pimeloyl-ACP methyl ester carboxylesterase